MNLFLYVVDKTINIIVIFLMLLFLFIGVYGIYDAHHIYEEVEMGEELRIIRDNQDELFYDNLKELNDDIVSWITIDNTSIDYPILQGKDNMEYINKNYNGEYSYVGSIFLDYRNKSNFKDSYSIIYGHSLKKGMFTDIVNYQDNNYFDEHTKGSLIVENGIYEIEIISFAKINYRDDMIYNKHFIDNNSKKEIYNYIIKVSDKKTKNIEYSNDVNYLILSTCNPDEKDERFILLAKLVNFKENTIIR